MFQAQYLRDWGVVCSLSTRIQRCIANTSNNTVYIGRQYSVDNITTTTPSWHSGMLNIYNNIVCNSQSWKERHKTICTKYLTISFLNIHWNHILLSSFTAPILDLHSHNRNVNFQTLFTGYFMVVVLRDWQFIWMGYFGEIMFRFYETRLRIWCLLFAFVLPIIVGFAYRTKIIIELAVFSVWGSKINTK